MTKGDHVAPIDRSTANAVSAARGRSKRGKFRGATYTAESGGAVGLGHTKSVGSSAAASERMGPTTAVQAALSTRVSLDVPQIASRALLPPSLVADELGKLIKGGLVIRVSNDRFKRSDG